MAGSAEVVSVLDDAAQITKSIQGGRHAFVGKAINDLAVLETSLSLDTPGHSESGPLRWPPHGNGRGGSSHRSTGSTKILVQDFQKRGLGRALNDVGKICLLLDPRFKSLCTAVCLNGGNDLQNEVRALVEYKFSSFSGNVTFSAGSFGIGSSGDGQIKAREAPKQERQAPKARGGGSGGTGAEAGAPPAMSRMDKIRADMNKIVARPAGDVDAPEL